jgi:hypothetical protein
MAESVSVDWNYYDSKLFSREVLSSTDRFPERYADFEGATDDRVAILCLIGIDLAWFQSKARNRSTPIPLIAYQEGGRNGMWHVGKPERLGCVKPKGAPRDRPAFALRVPRKGVSRACIGCMDRNQLPMMFNTGGLSRFGEQHWSERRAGGAEIIDRLAPMTTQEIAALGRKVCKDVAIARTKP